MNNSLLTFLNKDKEKIDPHNQEVKTSFFQYTGLKILHTEKILMFRGQVNYWTCLSCPTSLTGSP